MLDSLSRPGVAQADAPEAVARPRAATASSLQLGLFWLLLVFSLTLALRAYGSFQLGTYHDDAIYVLLARSLAFESSYGIPGATLQLPTTRFPFGFPLVLKPFVLAAPDRFDLYAVPSLVATGLNCGLIFFGWRWLAPGTTRWLGLAVVGLYGLSPISVGHAGMVMSEALFTTCALAAIILGQRLAGRRPSWLALLALGTLLAMAYAIRTVGLTVAVAVLAYLVWPGRGRSGWTAAAATAALALIVLGLVAATQPLTLDDIVPWKYVEGWRTSGVRDPLVPRVARAIPEYAIQYVPQLLTGSGFTDALDRADSSPAIALLRRALGLALTALVAAGLVMHQRAAGWSCALLFTLLYMAVALVWSYRHERVIYPLQPMLALGFLLGCLSVARWVVRLSPWPTLVQAAPRLVAVLTATLIGLHAVQSESVESSLSHVGDLAARSAWIAAHAEPDALFVGEEPWVDGLYASRPGVMMRLFDSGDELAAYAKRYRARYVLVAPALEWLPAHVPRLSDTVERSRVLLEALVSERRAELLYADDKNLVRVYRLIQ